MPKKTTGPVSGCAAIDGFRPELVILDLMLPSGDRTLVLELCNTQSR